jgi:YlqD protein
MKLLQSVLVKQVLTEKSKGELQEKYHTNKLQLQKECDQLQFELKKLEKTKRFQQQSLKNQFDKEIQNRIEKVKLIEFQLEQLHMLPLGSELKEQEVQALVDIDQGDRWSALTQRKTIVVKDDIVIEIR